MLKILIAEDDFASRRYLGRFLEQYGVCDTVVDGMETVEAFVLATRERKPYDAVFLDIMMPKLDGVNVLKTIRELEKQGGPDVKNPAKIIMVTALGEARLVRSAFEHGCDAYASKPLDTAKLLEAMRKLGLIDRAGDGR